MDSQFDLVSHWMQWTMETFGRKALGQAERASRFVEEAIELAQAAGVDRAAITAMVDRVYSRKPGAIGREVGQCRATLDLLAGVLNIDPREQSAIELARVKTIPREEWEKRHTAKVALGFAEPMDEDTTGGQSLGAATDERPDAHGLALGERDALNVSVATPASASHADDLRVPLPPNADLPYVARTLLALIEDQPGSRRAIAVVNAAAINRLRAEAPELHDQVQAALDAPAHQRAML